VVGVYLQWPRLREHSAVERVRSRLSDNPQAVTAKLDAESASAALRRRRPEWDERRIERVARALFREEGSQGPWGRERQSSETVGESDSPSNGPR